MKKFRNIQELLELAADMQDFAQADDALTELLKEEAEKDELSDDELEYVTAARKDAPETSKKRD